MGGPSSSEVITSTEHVHDSRQKTVAERSSKKPRDCANSDMALDTEATSLLSERADSTYENLRASAMIAGVSAPVIPVSVLAKAPKLNAKKAIDKYRRLL